MYNMELNLSELNNINTMNPYDTFDYNSYQQQGQENYWETEKKKDIEIKKKKVSFNDILSNMNLVVNKQGVLQFMAPNNQQQYQNSLMAQEVNYNQQDGNQYSNNFSQVDSYQNKKIFYQNQKIQEIQQKSNTQPLDASVKHSYIYNKYFKDYVDPNAEKHGPRVPKTKEEYYQMLLDDRKRAIEHKLRIEQIKSKKLLFTTNPSTTLNPRNIQPSKNNLRTMTFK